MPATMDAPWPKLNSGFYSTSTPPPAPPPSPGATEDDFLMVTMDGTPEEARVTPVQADVDKAPRATVSVVILCDGTASQGPNVGKVLEILSHLFSVFEATKQSRPQIHLMLVLMRDWPQHGEYDKKVQVCQVYTRNEDTPNGFYVYTGAEGQMEYLHKLINTMSRECNYGGDEPEEYGVAVHLARTVIEKQREALGPHPTMVLALVDDVPHGLSSDKDAFPDGTLDEKQVSADASLIGEEAWCGKPFLPEIRELIKEKEGERTLVVFCLVGKAALQGKCDLCKHLLCELFEHVEGSHAWLFANQMGDNKVASMIGTLFLCEMFKTDVSENIAGITTQTLGKEQSMQSKVFEILERSSHTHKGFASLTSYECMMEGLQELAIHHSDTEETEQTRTLGRIVLEGSDGDFRKQCTAGYRSLSVPKGSEPPPSMPPADTYDAHPHVVVHRSLNCHVSEAPPSMPPADTYDAHPHVVVHRSLNCHVSFEAPPSDTTAFRSLSGAPTVDASTVAETVDPERVGGKRTVVTSVEWVKRRFRSNFKHAA